MLVIADDITGAAETAGVCLRYGLSVSFGIDELPAQEADIRIIATDSRSLTEDEAFNIHKAIAESTCQQTDVLIFKKCDSALRGYVLTELSALAEAGGLDKVVLQPANPLSGRFIKNGEYYIGSDKIENTGFSHDPDFPACESSVRNILHSRSTYHHKFDIQTGEINRISENGVYVPDCLSVADLVKSSNLAGEKTLMCGSAAFFEQILIKKFNPKKINQDNNFTFPEEFMLISGSTHPESRSFIEKQKVNNCRICTFPAHFYRYKIGKKEIEGWANVLANEWKKSKRLIVTTPTTSLHCPEDTKIPGQRMGIVIQKLLLQVSVAEIFVTGGATTYTLLKTLNWKTLIPVHEISPGVVRMKVSDSETFLTMKPGSYSWPVASIL